MTIEETAEPTRQRRRRVPKAEASARLIEATIKLLRERPLEPPAAPVRPYLSGQPSPATTHRQETDLPARIRAAVTARLGTQVDPALLDVIIERVLNSTGAK